ncbi:GSCOCG00001221001-RA-CDS [Cotesia congregata]|nr:GSCOCG00001221001-RA-CDS [Cotesia congregata]
MSSEEIVIIISQKEDTSDLEITRAVNENNLLNSFKIYGVMTENPRIMNFSGGEPSDVPKKKGFFKNFWKRSRHYSLENQ